MTSTEVIHPPVQYEPSLGEGGVYVDKVPSPIALAKGVRCSCSTRQTVFTTRSSLLIHFKSVSHQTWLETQNRDKDNHFMEVVQLRDLVKQQTLLIAERDQQIIHLEKNMREKERVIRTLSTMLSAMQPVTEEEDDNPAEATTTLLDIDM